MIHGFVYFWRSNLIGKEAYRSFSFQPLVAVGEDADDGREVNAVRELSKMFP